MEKILASKASRASISVFVRDNGSSDSTLDILKKFSTAFIHKGIYFAWATDEVNRGFDRNVYECYRLSKAKYIWFVSDDDNLADGAIDTIVSDVLLHTPTVAYYNFEQEPYSKKNPYIQKSYFFECAHMENFAPISKIARWPKLTSIVLKSGYVRLLPIGLESEKLGFMHVALALSLAITHGRVYHSSIFIAYPDDDYLEHIDFPPYIGNNLIVTVRHVLTYYEKSEAIAFFNLKRSDPLVLSIRTLTGSRLGKTKISSSLKEELISTVKLELKSQGILVIFNRKFLSSVIGYLLVPLRLSLRKKFTK